MTFMVNSIAVKKLREAAGMSQQELAIAAGLSISAVSQLEQGKKTNPTVSTVVALARVLGVKVDTLLADEPPRNQKPKRTRKKP